MNEPTTPQTWPDIAIGLYDRLTGRNAEITYELDHMEILVPDRVGEGAGHTKWVLNGALKIRTRDGASG